MRRDIPPNWSVDVVACRPLSTGNSLRPALINRLQSMSLVSTIKCTAKRHLFLSLNLKFRKLNVFNVEMVETFGRAPSIEFKWIFFVAHRHYQRVHDDDQFINNRWLGPVVDRWHSLHHPSSGRRNDSASDHTSSHEIHFSKMKRILPLLFFKVFKYEILLT